MLRWVTTSVSFDVGVGVGMEGEMFICERPLPRSHPMACLPPPLAPVPHAALAAAEPSLRTQLGKLLDQVFTAGHAEKSTEGGAGKGTGMQPTPQAPGTLGIARITVAEFMKRRQSHIKDVVTVKLQR
jgi:hypothetical protein